jgi:hypothetical protein
MATSISQRNQLLVLLGYKRNFLLLFHEILNRMQVPNINRLRADWTNITILYHIFYFVRASFCIAYFQNTIYKSGSLILHYLPEMPNACFSPIPLP